MVSIRTLPENNTASTHSSTGSIPTEVLHPKDEDYDMNLPPYPPGFSRFQFFLPDEEIWSSMLATMSQCPMGRPMIKDDNASNAMLTAPSSEHTKKNSRGNWSHIILMMLLTWWETNRCSKPQAPT